MPYCDRCERHWTPTSMQPDGTCPTCGQALARAKPLRPAVTPARPPEAGDDEGDHAAGKAPWHFKLLLLVLVVYLSWRAVQGVEWVAHHL